VGELLVNTLLGINTVDPGLLVDEKKSEGKMVVQRISKVDWVLRMVLKEPVGSSEMLVTSSVLVIVCTMGDGALVTMLVCALVAVLVTTTVCTLTAVLVTTTVCTLAGAGVKELLGELAEDAVVMWLEELADSLTEDRVEELVEGLDEDGITGLGEELRGDGVDELARVLEKRLVEGLVDDLDE
jgi:hypothetical protein